LSLIHPVRQWVKRRDDPLADAAYRLAKSARHASLPVVPAVHRALYGFHQTVAGGWAYLTRALWYTPLFQSRLTAPAPALFLYGGMPLVTGPVTIALGRGCRLSAQVTISGRAASADPCLEVGDNVDIGWQTTIAVGRRVRIGDNVRIAGRAFLAGYPGHPLDALTRAAGLPDTEDQVGDIVLEDDVWLATGVTVSAGVTIGARTVVAAGSVVTKNLPPDVLAGGCPARVIKPIGGADGT
jgi:acetyltransferase-like isoleucine patch superfamily enzyme